MTRKPFTAQLMNIDTVDLPVWSLPYLINGDASGLSDEDERTVAQWERTTLKAYAHSATAVISADADAKPFFTQSPEFGPACDCITADIYIRTDRLSLDALPRRETDSPRSGQTATGYGAAIPTGHMVTVNGREYRVYCTTYSNTGTCWIQTKHGRIIIEDSRP